MKLGAQKALHVIRMRKSAEGRYIYEKEMDQKNGCSHGSNHVG